MFEMAQADILKCLKKGTATSFDLSKRLKLSISAVHTNLRKLHKMGVIEIKGYKKNRDKFHKGNPIAIWGLK